MTLYRYTKNSKSDDSVEHLLELGYVRMTNLLPNEVYPEVIVPTEIHSNMPVDRKVTLNSKLYLNSCGIRMLRCFVKINLDRTYFLLEQGPKQFVNLPYLQINFLNVNEKLANAWMEHIVFDLFLKFN